MRKLLYRNINKDNLFGSRFVFLKKGADKPSKKSSVEDILVAKFAVDKIEGVGKIMDIKMKLTSPRQAAEWACREVNRLANNASYNFKGNNAEKFKKQIFNVAQKAITTIDRNEKNAEFDIKEKKVTARLKANATALAKVGSRDIKFHKALVDTVFGLDSSYFEIEGMEVPDGKGKKAALLNRVQAQAASVNRRAIAIITYWEGEISKMDATAVRVRKALEANPVKRYPYPSDVNMMENHKFSLENRQILEGSYFVEAGLGRKLDITIARLHNISQDARKMSRTTIEDWELDEGYYKKLDELREIVVSCQESLVEVKASKRRNTNKEIYLASVLKGATNNYTKLRNRLGKRELVLAGRIVLSSIDILNYRLAQREGKKAPKDMDIRIAKYSDSKESEITMPYDKRVFLKSLKDTKAGKKALADLKRLRNIAVSNKNPKEWGRYQDLVATTSRHMGMEAPERRTPIWEDYREIKGKSPVKRIAAKKKTSKKALPKKKG